MSRRSSEPRQDAGVWVPSLLAEVLPPGAGHMGKRGDARLGRDLALDSLSRAVLCEKIADTVGAEFDAVARLLTEAQTVDDVVHLCRQLDSGSSVPSRAGSPS
jgi:hypothetical protein